MQLLPIYILLGLADRWAALVLGPSPGTSDKHGARISQPSPVPAGLLLVAAGLLLAAALLPLAGPPVMSGLQPLGAKGLAVVAGGLAVGLLSYVLVALVRYLMECHAAGKAIYDGVQRPRWRR